jgi:hypothetical protein
MDPKVKNKINSIIYDINAIARELEEISNGLRYEFKGIGSVKSASSLQNAAYKYKRVSQELRNI